MKNGLILGWLCAPLLCVPQFSAAETPTILELDSIEQIRACDELGTGFIRLPQRNTCLNFGGSITHDVMFGADVYTGEAYRRASHTTSASIFMDARTQSELGMLRSYFGIKGSVVDGEIRDAYLNDAFIELEGFLVGATGSQFDLWLNSAGKVLNDDVIPYGGGTAYQFTYTGRFDNGFSAMLAFEHAEEARERADQHSRWPHLVGGLKYNLDWGEVGTVIGYDTTTREFVAKARLDVWSNNGLSLFLMGGYQADAGTADFFGAWSGSFAAWGGASYDVSPKTVLNAQAAFDTSGTYSLAINVDYEIVPGLLITPEVAYTSFGGSVSEADHALLGMVSIYRGF